MAYRLKARLVRQDVKSTTAGRDLLYSFDEVARFREANRGESKPLIEYVRFSALGEAIVRTWGGEGALTSLRQGANIADDALPKTTQATTATLLPQDPQFAKAKPEHCVVLIDEIDKAPRDTPNDLLAEFELLAFDVPELGLRIAADARWRPIVIMTSNSERALPEAFLRRCLFFNIPPPSPDDMAQIVSGFIKELPGTPLFTSAFAFYEALRREPTVRKKPGTAEFLAWCGALFRLAGQEPDKALTHKAETDDRVLKTLICLAKAKEDLVLAETLYKSGDWQAQPTPG
ncbi:MoxR family ATPase [Sphingomonas sp. PB2P19]